MKLFFKVVAAIPLLLGSQAIASWFVAKDGHLDLRFLYDEATQEGLFIRLLDYKTSELIALSDATIRVQGQASLVSRPEASVWGPIGVAAGETFWLLPQSQNVALPWLGTRAEIQDGIFRTLPPAPDFGTGQLSLKLVSVEGSGPEAGGQFALLSIDAVGFPSFAWSTADGIDGLDVIAPINTRSHTHYNWTFSQPGDYLVTMEVSGFTKPNETLIRAQGTLHFQVLPPEVVEVADFSIQPTPSGLVLNWMPQGNSKKIMLWRSSDMNRWWIDTLMGSEQTTYALPPLPPAERRFWRLSDPVEASQP